MTSASPAGRSFRRQLTDAARALRPEEPMRLLAKRLAPLVRQKEKLGQLQVLLRLTFDASAPARGVLVFEWPKTAHGHSIVSVLERWSGRCADGTSRDGTLVSSCRDVLGADDRVEGTHLKVEFELETLPESMDELLAVAARVGLSEVLDGRVDEAPKTAKKPAKKAAKKAAPKAVRPAQPKQAQPKRPAKTAPPRVVDPAQQAAIDSIQHNAVFDSSTHPKVGVNEEVTSSSGVTFRLITKRVGGHPRRVWIRVASTAAVSRAS